ncbi:MAG: RQC domain-containing protein, partial [Pseudomonadota bacterium]
PAETLTLFGPEDIRLRRAQIDEGLAPVERKQADHARLNALLGLAESPVCRRVPLLRYFGEEFAGGCGGCDICSDPPETFDAKDAARKAFSAALRTGEWFGAGHLIDILRGQATEKVRAKGHDGLPTFGVGKEFSKAEWQAIFRQLMGLDLLRPDAARHGALRLTEAARPLLRGEVELTLRRDSVKRAAARARPAAKALVAEEDEPLLSALKAKRRELAEAAKAPAYVIFPDRTLIDMVAKRPRSLDQMRAVSGVGEKKVEKFGAVFLEVLTGDAAAPVHPARMALAGRDAGGLFDALEAEQVRLARGESGLEPFMDCSKGTLRKIAEMRPATLEDLALVPGMGAAKVARFGAAFLAVLEGAVG